MYVKYLEQSKQVGHGNGFLGRKRISGTETQLIDLLFVSNQLRLQRERFFETETGSEALDFIMLRVTICWSELIT